MDLVRARFEAQFGSEWSAPVFKDGPEQDPTVSADESIRKKKPEPQPKAVLGDAEDTSKLSESELESVGDMGLDLGSRTGSDGPVTVTHSEAYASSASRADRNKFMSSKAPKVILEKDRKASAAKSPEDEKDLANDLELQRLIDESHILAQHQDYSGADISFGDPMEQIGKQRLKIMEARLMKAGAKSKSQRVPVEIVKGMKAKAKERSTKTKEFAKEAGIILAREQKVRKQRVHDRGLKINSVGKATQHGIDLSSSEIARVQSRGKRKGNGKGKSKGKAKGTGLKRR